MSFKDPEASAALDDDAEGCETIEIGQPSVCPQFPSG